MYGNEDKCKFYTLFISARGAEEDAKKNEILRVQTKRKACFDLRKLSKQPRCSKVSLPISPKIPLVDTSCETVCCVRQDMERWWRNARN
jgi:hypothetical protein